MAQARRRPAKKTKNTPRTAGSGWGMLLTGMVIGSVLTALFLGWKQDPQHGFGSGINQMIEKSRQTQSPQDQAADKPVSNERPKSPSYDFYTILPEIEQVIPEEYTPPPVSKQTPEKTQPEKQTVRPDHYLLQAGSFGKREEADQLKARLALSGYESYIQKVTVDGKKYYRVRMGPFRNLEKLDKASSDLSSKGINAMRIKVSKG